jgi:hypothetical protein
MLMIPNVVRFAPFMGQDHYLYLYCLHENHDYQFMHIKKYVA